MAICDIAAFRVNGRFLSRGFFSEYFYNSIDIQRDGIVDKRRQLYMITNGSDAVVGGDII